MKEKEYKFRSNEIETQIPHLAEKGITEFSIHDEKLSCDKTSLLRIMRLAAKKAPDVYFSFLIDAGTIDRELVGALQNLFCSIDIPLRPVEKGGKLLFDKKFFANKANLLNQAGIVFGFQLEYAAQTGDTLKAFMERLDFAVNQYPNHIDFSQTENAEEAQTASVSGIFSAKDIRYARDLSFACRTFYSAGRAVPWFLNVLKPLKIYPSRFFADFAEWQRCNNCDFKSGFLPEEQNHTDIEKMQLLFLAEKYEEKNQHDLIALVDDIVRINGAISRLEKEGDSCELELSYSADDLLGPEAFDLKAFLENVCMEPAKIKLKIENGELKCL
ncbi:hypothetical protein [Treponema sp. C6A8]|uniref:hypothetical protein n=1 Tax=Treponema sp. C6A8 TaxID=1410609 RepID=UPI0004898C14|nr:hypothetical protein [Treponema sp. C6A8]